MQSSNESIEKILMEPTSHTTSINPKIGLVHQKLKGNPLYLANLIAYEGFFVQFITLDQLGKASNWPEFLIFIDDLQISSEICKRCKEHLEAGKAILAIGLVKGIEQLTGVLYRSPNAFPFPIGGFKSMSVGEGYLQYNNSEILAPFRPLYFPLHGFGCLPVQLQTAKSLATYRVTTPAVPSYGNSQILSDDDREDFWPAITENHVGKGVCAYIGLDLVKTIRHIQEGRYIETDGIPPADGMSPIDDGILKCEDGCVLDWNKDRRLISPIYQVPAFLIPITDLWRQILRRTIEYCADCCNIAIQRIDYWPDGVEFIGLISHDTDGNDEVKAVEMLERVNRFGIQTTWCLISPGFSSELCQRILNSGHELAFHFDAQSFSLPDIFSFETLQMQLEETAEHTGITSFYSNKNHYTRWERKTDFFEWCEKVGLKIDQSKGPSKCGTQGFPFGTAHPWRAMNSEGEFINCYEVGFVSQDLGFQGPIDTGEELLEACRSVQGVCHLIFHPAHVRDRKVESAFGNFIESAKKKGARFMRSDEIGKWVDLRKKNIENLEWTDNSGLILLTRNCSNHAWEKAKTE
jgi:hypothetical protein